MKLAIDGRYVLAGITFQIFSEDPYIQIRDPFGEQVLAGAVEISNGYFCALYPNISQQTWGAYKISYSNSHSNHLMCMESIVIPITPLVIPSQNIQITSNTAPVV